MPQMQQANWQGHRLAARLLRCMFRARGDAAVEGLRIGARMTAVEIREGILSGKLLIVEREAYERLQAELQQQRRERPMSRSEELRIAAKRLVEGKRTNATHVKPVLPKPTRDSQ